MQRYYKNNTIVWYQVWKHKRLFALNLLHDDMPIKVTIVSRTGFLIASYVFDLTGSDCANKICKAICHNCSL